MGANPASLAIKAGMMALQMGLTAMNKTEGPRLDSLDVTTADFGTPLNYFWGKRRLEGVPIIWAEKLREKKTTSKTKGGKYANYKYFGTWAVAIADHQIDAVSRIWMDKHLVYDVTAAGPVSPLIGVFQGLGDSPVKITNGRNMRIYLGNEAQEPDPRMEAWCEDRYGADSCPAYRGVAYIVFQDLPLEKFGNRIPQITVEAVNNSTDNFLDESFLPGAVLGPVFNFDRTRALFYNTSNTDYAIWDVPTNTKLIDSFMFTEIEEADYNENGKIWVVCGTLGDTLRIVTPDGHVVETTISIGANGDRLRGIGNLAYMRYNSGSADGYIRCNSVECTQVTTDFVPEMFFPDLDGKAWAIGMDGTNIRLYCDDDGQDYTIASPGGVSGFTSAFVNADGDFFIIVQTTAILIEAAAPTVVANSASIGGSADDLFLAMRQHPRGSSRFYTASQEIDAASLSVIRTYSINDWIANSDATHYYEPITHSLWGRDDPPGNVTIRYFDRIDSSGTDLADVIQDVSDRCGVVELDVSGLTQSVPGYSTVQGAGKEWIQPLLDIHDVDARPHNFAVQFLSRGSSAAGTIAVSEFVREGDEPRYALTIKQDTDLPSRVGLNFADSDSDQQKNTVISQRPSLSTDSNRELTIDLSTYVAIPGDAQKFADRYFRRKWNGREGVTNALTPQYLALEPGDIWNLQLDDVTQSHRLIKATIQQGRINTEWERDFAGLHNLGTGTGASMDGRDDDVIYVPAATKGFVLDIPLIEDADDDTAPQLYYAAGSYGGDWPGAVIYETDGDELSPWNAVDSADNAAWGYATEALPYADPWVWDRGNSVNISTFGTLTSSTEAAINADPQINLAYLGGELINYTTATLEGDGTYTLSGLRRGRRGTEWACDDHEVGDEFVPVDTFGREGMGLSQVGLTKEFRAQSLGRDASSSPVIEVDFSGATLKPYAPANFTAVRDASSGDWTITGVRRTRIGGAWVGGTTIPLSEASEGYDVVILDGEGNEVRSLDVTINGDGSFSASYSASNQTTDFGSIQSFIEVAGYQVSAAVGRGFPATILSTASGAVLPATITAGVVSYAVNANVTPANPDHQSGDTLLCAVLVQGTGASVACATSGWTDADGVSNPTTMNGSRLWLFQNECDSDSESDPAITCSGGSGTETVVAVVLRIPRRNTAANFGIGTVSANASTTLPIAFAQNSPSIDNGNAILAISTRSNDYISGGGPGVITGITAGLSWTELVDFSTTFGNDTSFFIDYAINDSGSAYTAGTAGVKSPTYSVAAVSAALYVEVPLL